jgi:hypothetical protein
MELLTLLKDMLPQGNTVPKTVYEAKQIIYPLGWRWRKSTCARMIAFYIVDLSTNTSRNALFVDLTDSIVEKMVEIMRTAIETKEKVGLKRCFGTFLSILI